MTENHGTGVSSPETLSSVGEFLGAQLRRRASNSSHVRDGLVGFERGNKCNTRFLFNYGEDVMYESSRTRHVQHGGML